MSTILGTTAVRFIPEPTLSFGYGQAVEDPRDGLTLFGPLDHGRPYGIRAGVVGTSRGIAYFEDWLARIQQPLRDAGSPVARPMFPGIEAAFRVPWPAQPSVVVTVPEAEIHGAVFLDDRHQRVYQAVGVYADRILAAVDQQEDIVDLWFVVIPDVVYDNCRPLSRVPTPKQIAAPRRLNPRLAKRLAKEPSLWEDENEAATPYQYDVDFHNQLKARLLGKRVLTQVVRESTVIPVTGISESARPRRDSRKFQAAIAWNLGTAAFYKSGGRPWKIADIRKGVCYIGVVFKREDRSDDPRAACCAAQMFLDSGDGIVFKGAVGPWYSPAKDEYHLTRAAAKELISLAIASFAPKPGDHPPAEIFLHGKVSFDDEEWSGFESAIDASRTRLVGVKIRDGADLRLFRLGSHPVLRGTAYVRHSREAYLWTRGFSPRLQTYVGREVPRALRIGVERGDADMNVVLADIMALTKLNYNTCLLSDGLPVTLRFADAVGEILTAAPGLGGNPLPFRHYI